MSHKSLFRKFFRLFANGKSVVSSKNISKAEAINLQQEYIAESCVKNADSLPPYLEIFKQLDSPKNEIFSAALYYLQQIALNEGRYKADIIKSLQDKCQSKKFSEEKIQQITEMLGNIE